MAIKAIAYSYWRRIKDKARSFAALLFTLKEKGSLPNGTAPRTRTLSRSRAAFPTV